MQRIRAILGAALGWPVSGSTMVTIYSVRMPNGEHLSWIYSTRRERAEEMLRDGFESEYGPNLLLIEVARLTPAEAIADRTTRVGDKWWVE